MNEELFNVLYGDSEVSADKLGYLVENFFEVMQDLHETDDFDKNLKKVVDLFGGDLESILQLFKAKKEALELNRAVLIVGYGSSSKITPLLKGISEKCKLIDDYRAELLTACHNYKTSGS